MIRETRPVQQMRDPLPIGSQPGKKSARPITDDSHAIALRAPSETSGLQQRNFHRGKVAGADSRHAPVCSGRRSESSDDRSAMPLVAQWKQVMTRSDIQDPGSEAMRSRTN